MSLREDMIIQGTGRRQFRLVVDMENAAFDPGSDDPRGYLSELCSVLDQLVDKLREGGFDHSSTNRLNDVNGQHVGVAWVQE